MSLNKWTNFAFGDTLLAWAGGLFILTALFIMSVAALSAGCSSTSYRHVKGDEQIVVTDQTFFHARSVETAKFAKNPDGTVSLEVNGGKTNTDAADTIKAAADLAKNLRPSP